MSSRLRSVLLLGYGQGNDAWHFTGSTGWTQTITLQMRKISNVQMTMRARAKALQLKGDYPVVEVWEGARLVARIATGGAG